MIKGIVLTICIFLLTTTVKAEKVYEFNSTCQQAYLEISKLKFNNAKVLLEKAKQQNPENLIPSLLENYIDFFPLFLSEDADEYAKFKVRIAERIALLETGPQTSPFYKFSLSVVYMQKAAIEIKFVENWRAGWDIRKSFQLIKENKKTFVTFAPNDLVMGILQSVTAVVPKGYAALVSLLGMNGSMSEGLKLINNFVNSSDPYAKLMNAEGTLVYCYLAFYLQNKHAEVFALIKNKKLDIVNNLSLTYMASNLAINDKQIDYAKSIILNRNKSNEYLQIAAWDYELAYIKLYKQEFHEAAQYFETYLANFKGNFYVKDTYLKLSWCYYLQGNMTAAEAARNNVIKKGALYTDADKQALQEAKTGTWANITLLKARLLNDGGMNKEALQLLNTKGFSSFTKEEEKLQFTYRYARINDDMRNDAEAIQYYLKTIEIGATRKEYFAARAALQIAEIYERQNKKTIAVSYYQKCLDMKDHEYKNSLDQKAKSGIARCTGE